MPPSPPSPPSSPSSAHSSPSSPPPTPPLPSTLPTPPSSPYKTHTYTPTERSIFAPSPYKSLLLPLWRFSTPAAAQTSARSIHAYFLAFVERGDFVGADNARKFLQMGMTRAARYANYKGGRKYVNGKVKAKKDAKGKGKNVMGKEDGGGGEGEGEDNGEDGGGEEKEEEDWEGRREKREARDIFRRYWERAKGSGEYQRMKEEFLARRKEWEREMKGDGERTEKRRKKKAK